jgi:hypothetical protein
MDVPITLRFFEKLNLYQDISKRDGQHGTTWHNERNILAWAANSNRHMHLHTPLTVDMAFDRQEITGEIVGVADPKEQIRQIFGNLVMRGYASWGSNETEIRFTRDGFTTGEIINEIVAHPSKNGVYRLVYWLCRAIFIAAAVVAVGEGLKTLHEFWEFLSSSQSLLQLFRSLRQHL